MSASSSAAALSEISSAPCIPTSEPQVRTAMRVRKTRRLFRISGCEQNRTCDCALLRQVDRGRCHAGSHQIRSSISDFAEGTCDDLTTGSTNEPETAGLYAFHLD
jgi:hypothetical protein